jgi:Tfp pilus assembly protein PilO
MIKVTEVEMKKEVLEKIFLVLLIFGGLAYSYITFLLEPQMDKIKMLSDELVNQQGRYDQLIAYQRSPLSLQEEIKQLEKQNTNLAAQIPNSIDKPQTMYYIYSLAKSAQVEPLSLSFEKPQNEANFQSMGMNFSCFGRVNDVLNFTKKLQFEGTQKMGIQSISFVNQNGGIKAEIKLVAYASNIKITEDSVQSVQPSGQPLTPGQGYSSVEQIFQK